MKRVLYLGIDPPRSTNDIEYTHHPLIKIIPRDPSSPDIQQMIQRIEEFTHLIVTSKNTVRCLATITDYRFPNTQVIAVGKETAVLLKKEGFPQAKAPGEETAEGILKILSAENFSNSLVLWPHSALSRSIIANYLKARSIPTEAPIIYNTVPNKELKLRDDLDSFDALYFTSPSCVDAFILLYGSLPRSTNIESIGPVTSRYLRSSFLLNNS
ncbi:MAG: uroporphyrinogen-III synthase [Chlamydiales bacterium]|nr:uroporphyrinogen-III synthase [Chlamydiia bacterium]MCP5508613.1 uroporphyrinogen-III synthase [Chlamydiales bacterium]